LQFRRFGAARVCCTIFWSLRDPLRVLQNMPYALDEQPRPKLICH
jgi:hypothetical protein